ncbi:MAG: helix-hairpin-helix domain-containing protein [Fulvivirga sp.]
MKPFLLTILALGISSLAFAQLNQQKAIDIERFIEEVFAVQNGDVSAEELYETLLLFYSNPINLNNTNKDELRSLFILSELQINNLVSYIEENGNLLSIYELQAIPDFDLNTIYRLTPFVTVKETGLNRDNRGFIERVLSEPNNYLLLRYETVLEDKKGYLPKQDSSDSRYVGNKGKYYTRFRVSHINDFSIGFTAEKDAGEQLAWNPKTKKFGADFYSGHIQLQNQGRFKNIVIGDYQIQYGQSLLLGAGFNVGKGAETITTVRRSNLGIRPYTSVIETNFFRGGAATVSIAQNLEFTGFYSRLNQDAALKEDTLERENFITSIQQSGFHRTDAELNAKNKVVESNYGGTLLYQPSKHPLTLGSTFIVNEFSTSLIRAERVYNNFEFKGTSNYNIGLFGDYNWQNISLFAEGAMSKSGGLGGVIGAIINLNSRLETSMVLRNYDKDFHSLYGNAFGESTRNINEQGWYWGMKYKPFSKVEFTGYFDSFRYQWLTSSINAPSTGFEYLGRVSYRPTRNTLLFFQFREQAKDDNPSANDQEEVIRFPLLGKKRNYTVNLDFQANDWLSFKSRVQWSSYDFNNKLTEGFAIWQDMNLDFGKFRISGRYAIFGTDDFNNAQYAYERDLLYAFSVPAYSGTASRHYVLIQYKPIKRITFWIKYAQTNYRDRDTIGTGLEQIEGNKRTDFKFQLRINF